MTDPDLVWTHVSDEQSAGRACVMCGRPTDEPGWSGVVVGRSERGGPLYACSGGTGDAPGRDRWSDPRVVDPRVSGRNCAEQAAIVVPDSLEGLDPGSDG